MLRRPVLRRWRGLKPLDAENTANGLERPERPSRSGTGRRREWPQMATDEHRSGRRSLGRTNRSRWATRSIWNSRTQETDRNRGAVLQSARSILERPAARNAAEIMWKAGRGRGGVEPQMDTDERRWRKRCAVAGSSIPATAGTQPPGRALPLEGCAAPPSTRLCWGTWRQLAGDPLRIAAAIEHGADTNLFANDLVVDREREAATESPNRFPCTPA